MTHKYVAYYRVSTQKQGRSGLGLEAQQEAIRAFLAQVQGVLIGEVTEIETGTRKGNDRPELAKALALCRIHGAKLAVARLDRLARNVHFISSLMESGVNFVAADFPQANSLTVHLLSSVGEYEAELISKRTKAALAAAKARGVKLGGDYGIGKYAASGNKASAVIRHERAAKRASDLLPVIAAIKADGATSLRQVADTLNERGIPASRGGQWQAAQVLQIMRMAEGA